MDAFEGSLSDACETALKEMLGGAGFASTIYHLSRLGVSIPDCARDPASFDDALSTLFNPAGALFIEGRVLKRLYQRNYGGRFEWGDGLSFPEEVRKARSHFNGGRSYAVEALGATSFQNCMHLLRFSWIPFC